MSTDTPINYEAVLADLEARKAKIEAAIEAIRTIMAQGGTPTSPGGGPGGTVQPDSFLKMSIPDASKKYLTMTRQKQSTQNIIDALERGGLPRSKYTTVYSILRRREKQVGDIINMQGDWALAEWYPNYRKGQKPVKETEAEPEEAEEKEKATASA